MTDREIRTLCILLLLLLICGAAYAPGPLRGLGVFACAILLAVVLAPRG